MGPSRSEGHQLRVLCSVIERLKRGELDGDGSNATIKPRLQPRLRTERDAETYVFLGRLVLDASARCRES